MTERVLLNFVERWGDGLKYRLDLDSTLIFNFIIRNWHL